MLDGVMRKLIDPVVGRWGQRLVDLGWTANRMTLLGLVLGLGAAVMIALGSPGWLALGPLLAGRLADGLDGAIARATQKSDFGGFLDIVADFLFYGAVPFAFALAAPGVNAIPASFLLLTFYANGASFLAYAVLAERHGLQTTARGEKSLYFTSGLLEGTETILFFVAFCLWPKGFPILAWIFGLLCLWTTASRVRQALRVFGALR
jgi:phosphatidylglycerophosphate synthase